MTNYHSSDGRISNVPCELVPSRAPGSGLLLKVGNVEIQKLCADGTLMRMVLSHALAAEIGLQLDGTGRVLCV